MTVRDLEFITCTLSFVSTRTRSFRKEVTSAHAPPFPVPFPGPLGFLPVESTEFRAILVLSLILIGRSKQGVRYK